MSERKVKVPCPYCKFKNEITVRYTDDEKRMRKCGEYSMLRGGCEREYIVDITVTVDIKALKIEGVEDAK